MHDALDNPGIEEAVDALLLSIPGIEEATLLAEIVAELARARAKFPGPNCNTLALVEEVGELATAVFSEDRPSVRGEAVQVAVMAMRVALEGDATIHEWRRIKGLDPLTSSQP